MYKDRLASDEADLEERRIEIERLRQIGPTIDPATAETAFFWTDMNDPYDILQERYHEGQSGHEYFARIRSDAQALWERDRRKLGFPHGLNPADEIINKPPLA